MKIKKLGWTSFLINNKKISLITDPDMWKESGVSVSKTASDVCLFTKRYDINKNILKEIGMESKIVCDTREEIMQIASSGEYEIAGLMVRRGLGQDIYIIDQGSLRVVYMGGVGADVDEKKFNDLGDVDVLIAPVGNGTGSPSYEKLEKIISDIDPSILVPCGFKEDGVKGEYKSREEFIKHFGFTNVRDESSLVLKPVDELEEKSIEVVFL